LDAIDYHNLLMKNADPGDTYLNAVGELCDGNEEKWEEAISQCDNLIVELSHKWQSLDQKLDEVQHKTRNPAITLLIDQSGSLRGDAILHLTASIKWLSEQFQNRQIKFEVLGFTTVRWQGGQSRRAWLKNGRPKYPGRLNDLLHLIYKPFAGDFVSESLNVMLHPRLLRENVDGEAIQWATERLQRQAEKEKLLVVVSDGAPVDDSTYAANGNSYMIRHFIQVRDNVYQEDKIALGGVGIGYDVDRYYNISEGSSDLTLIPEMIVNICSQLASSKN